MSTGGIYCEIPLGRLYDDTHRYGTREKIRKLFGIDARFLRQDVLDNFIINGDSQTKGLYQIVSRKLGRIMSSAKVPTNKEYYNRTIDLMRSTCAGIYHKGVLKRMYRFTGGKREIGASTASDWGSGPSSQDVERMERLASKYHPNPAQRAESFLKDYKVKRRDGFTVVIASTMPYAVRLEVEYRLSVLRLLYPRFSAMLSDFKQGGNGQVYYDYIFEKQ